MCVATSIPADRVHPPFSMLVENAAGCDVCSVVVVNALFELETYIEVKKRQRLTAFEIDDFMENFCDPWHIDGAWTRRLQFLVLPFNPEDEGSAVFFAVNISDQYYHCGRTCSTVKDICRFLVSNEQFDTFGAEVSQYTPNNALKKPEVKAKLAHHFCDHIFYCNQRNYTKETITTDLNSWDSTNRPDIEEEEYVPIHPSEFQQEFSRERRKGSSIKEYTPEELQMLQKYIELSSSKHTKDVLDADETDL